MCSSRDYVLARRCFLVDGNIYYTITRSTEHPAAPRKEKPHRVDRFYSSWVCRPAMWDVDDGDFGKPVSETILLHCEDLGIPKDIGKFVVRQGMFRMVRKIEDAARMYILGRVSQTIEGDHEITSICSNPTTVSNSLLQYCDDDSSLCDKNLQLKSFMRKMSKEDLEKALRQRRRIQRVTLVSSVLAAALLLQQPGLKVSLIGLGLLKARSKLFSKTKS